MADIQRSGLGERDIDQAIKALKKGAYLLKYGRRGKPKFCPFQLSNDESMLIWYSGKQEKHLKLSQVSRIIPGQRTAIFHRYPRPEKEYQSFSLIYNDRSLDLICKDKDEAEVWFVGLKALVARGNYHYRLKGDTRNDSASTESPTNRSRKSSPSISSFVCDPGPVNGHRNRATFESIPQNRLGKAFSEIVSYTAGAKGSTQNETVSNGLSSLTAGCIHDSNGRNSAAEPLRISSSSAVSSSSQGSCHDDFDALGDVFLWGEGIGDGVLGGGVHRGGSLTDPPVNSCVPKCLESTVVLDVYNIACGVRHAVLVTKQGEVFSWGEELGGRLGHGLEADVPKPKLIEALSGVHIEKVACGEYHTCAVTLSGEMYTWGGGSHNSGLLGHGSEASKWIPKRVSGDIEGVHISYVACGAWHTAVVTSTGKLFTFGDGAFGALGHGDRSSAIVPREVEALRGLRSTRVACGVWHTAAAVEVTADPSSPEASSSSSSTKLFTWGDGARGRLGHGDKESRLVPERVAALVDENICKVACGNDLTVALTSAGRVYTMGSSAYGQLGNPSALGKLPTLVGDKIADSSIEEIACGSYHVAVLTSKSELYTWGKGRLGQLGHGDEEDKNTPTQVDFLKDKQVKAVVCGSNYTAIICLHKSVSSADHSICSGCHNPFGFRRKRHNCYNCGLVFCKACSSRKSMKASLAPDMNKPYRVCDDCWNKLKRVLETGSVARIPRPRSGGNLNQKATEALDTETTGTKLQGQLSRILSTESAFHSESRLSKRDSRHEVDNRVFPAMTGNFQLWSFYQSNLSQNWGAFDSPNSAPVSRITSQASTHLRRKSPSVSSESGFQDSNQITESLNKEISTLRAQVEDLSSKSERLEKELQKKSRQLKEVSAIAADEAEKRKSAKEVIMSLTAQLKEIAQRLPEGLASLSASKNPFIPPNTSHKDSPTAARHSTEIESNGNSSDQQSSHRGTKTTHFEKSQRVVQAEPGVYMTLLSLLGGGNELKRVRFSRKHFTEQEAEKWWIENGAKLCERHHIQNTNK